MTIDPFLRLKKLVGGGVVSRAARHNRRQIQAELGADSHIDATRSRQNETLIGPPTAAGVAELAKRLMLEHGCGKLRRDGVRALEVVYSLPIGFSCDDSAFFAACAAWTADQFGGLSNILSFDVHRDEAALHAHALILPIVNGRMAGSALAGDRKRIAQLHGDFYKDVAAGFGLMRPTPKLTGARKAEAISRILAKLRAADDAAMRSTLWQEIRESINRDPRPYMRALGIDPPDPPPPARTMTQIFTSKGKGPAVEENSIGFVMPTSTQAAPHTADQNLSCVGVAPEPTPAPTAKIEPTQPAASTSGQNSQPAHGEVERLRDEDLNPLFFDPERGEFFAPTGRPAHRLRAINPRSDSSADDFDFRRGSHR